MKTLLLLPLAATAALCLAANGLSRLHRTFPASTDPEALALGVRALTGQLAAESFKEVMPVYPSEPGIVQQPEVPSDPAPWALPRIVAAHADAQGRVWVTLQDGTVRQVLASGEIVP